jgi:lysyl-tRNA synthetase, class II
VGEEIKTDVQNQPVEQDINELIKVKMQKLSDLQAAGKDPFTVMKYDVSNHTTEITSDFE